MVLESAQNATQDIELSYLTGGLGWKADYVPVSAGRQARYLRLRPHQYQRDHGKNAKLQLVGDGPGV